MEQQEAEDSTVLVSTAPVQGNCYMHEAAYMHLIKTCTGNEVGSCYVL